MDTPPVRTRTSDANPAPPRRPWTAPVIEDLGNMADLTLQGSVGGECPVENPLCFLGEP